VHVELSYQAPFGIDTLIENCIEKIFHKKLKAGDIDADLFRANAKKIYEGVKAGATKDGVQGPGSNLSQSMLHKLKLNSFTAAVFKNYKNNLEIAALVTDENGNRRSFEEFSKLAKPLLETYNKTHLQREYTLALRSSQTAAKWATYEKRGGKIKYQTVGDANVRDDHRLLDGTIKPVNDPFWDYHFPPNGWGCRCGTSWVSDDTPDVEPQGLPNLPPPFQNNPGKTGQIFNPKHPYFADVDGDTAAQLRKIAEKEAAIVKSYTLKDFKTVYKSESGGEVLEIKQKSQYGMENVNNMLIATLYAENKKKVFLVPVDGKVDGFVYKGNKLFDAQIQGKSFEFKTDYTGTTNAIDRHIRDAKDQADNITLHIKSSVSVLDLAKTIVNRLKRAKNVKQIHIIWNDSIYEFQTKGLTEEKITNVIK